MFVFINVSLVARNASFKLSFFSNEYLHLLAWDMKKHKLMKVPPTNFSETCRGEICATMCDHQGLMRALWNLYWYTSDVPELATQAPQQARDSPVREQISYSPATWFAYIIILPAAAARNRTACSGLSLVVLERHHHQQLLPADTNYGRRRVQRCIY
jgi:hypothetical protein